MFISNADKISPFQHRHAISVKINSYFRLQILLHENLAPGRVKKAEITTT